MDVGQEIYRFCYNNKFICFFEIVVSRLNCEILFFIYFYILSVWYSISYMNE